MKHLIAFSLLLISLIGGGYYLWQKTETAMAACQTQAITTLQTDLYHLPELKAKPSLLCERAHAQYAELQNCYQTVVNRYHIPTDLIEKYMLRQYPNYPSLVRNRLFLNHACP